MIAFLKGNSCPWNCWIHGPVKLGIQCWFGSGIYVQQLCVGWVPSSSSFRDPSNSNQALYADLFKVSCGLTAAPNSYVHFIEPNISWGKSFIPLKSAFFICWPLFIHGPIKLYGLCLHCKVEKWEPKLVLGWNSCKPHGPWVFGLAKNQPLTLAPLAHGMRKRSHVQA